MPLPPAASADPRTLQNTDPAHQATSSLPAGQRYAAAEEGKVPATQYDDDDDADIVDMDTGGDAQAAQESSSTSSSAKSTKQYYTFNRSSYKLMCKHLANRKTAASSAHESAFSQKRWRRLQDNLRLLPDEPMYRNLTWKGCPLIILPKEDWADVFQERHLITSSSDGTSTHLGLKATFQRIKSKYQTRRSRCGVTYEFVSQAMDQCSCRNVGSSSSAFAGSSAPAITPSSSSSATPDASTTSPS
ncbi:hypothetical protein RI367_000316 [Sorochytrium milnesiophthora]